MPARFPNVVHDASSLSGGRDGFVSVYWAPPMATTRPHVEVISADKTVGEIVDSMKVLAPYKFRERGRVIVLDDDGREHVLKQKYWNRIKVKHKRKVVFQYTLHDDGGDGGDGGFKQVLSIIISIAALVASIIIPGSGIPLLGIAAGSTEANLIGLGIGLLGSLLASAIAPPPTPPSQQAVGNDNQAGPTSIQGNVLQKAAPLSEVLGTRTIFPMFACQPLPYFSGDDQFIEAVYVLAGAHSISDIRINGTKVEDAADVEYEIKEGFGNDDPISLVTRYAATTSRKIELSKHVLDQNDSGGTVLTDQDTPNNSVPIWHQIRSGDADEVWINLIMPEGIYDQNNPGVLQGVAFRIRFRASSSDPWTNGPELHYQGKDPKDLKGVIKIQWGDDFETRNDPVLQDGWTAAFQETPYWTANSMFDGGASSGYFKGNAYLTNVRRVQLVGNECTIRLDSGTVAQGPLEIEITRSLCYTSFVPSAYTFGGSSRNVFSFIFTNSVATLYRSQNGLRNTVILVSYSSVTNSHPIANGDAGSGMTVIAIRAKNREVGNLTCSAGAYMNVWDGSDWDTIATSSNPAAQYRHIMSGPLCADPLSPLVLDDEALQEWYEACDSLGYNCNLVVEGSSQAEVMLVVAACGYARPYMSELWSVVRDYDRSAEGPVQSFTPRNASNFQLRLPFTKAVDALRVRYIDDDGATQEIIVWDPDVGPVANPRIEDVTYRGLTSGDDVVAKAQFDLRQFRLRANSLHFKTSMQGMVCQKGSLVAVNHDVLDEIHRSALIESVEYNEDGQVTGFWVDQDIDIFIEDDVTQVDDMTDTEDVSLVGRRTGVAIRDADSNITIHEVDGATSTKRYIELVTPFNPGTDDYGVPVVVEGNLTWFGPLATEHERMIVSGIEHDFEGNQLFSCVAEAQALFAA